jgi:hypothetical protein
MRSWRCNGSNNFSRTNGQARSHPVVRRSSVCIATNARWNHAAADDNCGTHRHTSVRRDVAAKIFAGSDLECFLSVIEKRVARTQQISEREWSAWSGLLAAASGLQDFSDARYNCQID